ncbi:hypothetical protein ACFOET_15800 [Parapedobacter deserti]|uniref:Uncharacterized protein n=1 Tax=Parapedobacter deserti TaxID=1912957 RepID=A0ABV7JM99_9SPHI
MNLLPEGTASRTGQLAVWLRSPCCKGAANTQLTPGSQQADRQAKRSSPVAVR